MKTIFSAAMVAASATAFDALAVPDFIAGLVYGLTGDNHLNEIETCYNSSKDLGQEALDALNKLKNHKWIASAREFATVFDGFSDALSSCENMQDDIAEIQAWATIFTEPAHLAETAAKNWALHRKTIKEDIAKEEADWSNAQYFDAGVDTALALTELVGPMTPLGMEIKAPFEFVAGLLYGFVEQNHLAELETCYKDDQSSFVIVENAIKAFEAGETAQGVELIGDFVTSLTTDVADCKAAGADVKAIEQWATIFTNKKELISTVSKHFLLHKKAMTADITTLKSDWSQGEYFQAGDVAADLLTIAVGPVEIAEVGAEPLGMPIKAPFEFAAGLLYGFVEENHLAELETCYKDDQSSFVIVENAIKAFEAGETEHGVELIGDFVTSLTTDVADCKAASADVKAIEQWATIFTNKKELISTVSKHFLLHKKAMTADITTLKSDWSQGEYFQAGDVAADLLTIAVGPVM